jgi:hypothetical protein
MDITSEVKQLRKIMPKAIITAHMDEKYLKYECDLRYANISPEEHDSYFEPIKKLFGERLMERYSHHTGYFDVFVRYPKDATKLN